MIDLIKKHLITDSEQYIILKNGSFLSGNGLSSLDFSDDSQLKIVHIIEKDTHINMNVSDNIKVSLTEIFYIIDNNAKVNVTLRVGADSVVDYLSFKQNRKCDNISIIADTYIGGGSYINLKNLTIFSSGSELTDNIYLTKSGGKVDMKNVIINVSGEKQAFNYNITHEAPDTLSTMHNYGISKNNSYLDIKSNGIIAAQAKKSELAQKTKGLIIDLFSQISAVPILKIQEYDCVAAHGASIGEINEDELYYLMSRGLTRTAAEKLIISGFVKPFFEDMIEDKSVEYIKTMIDKYI